MYCSNWKYLRRFAAILLFIDAETWRLSLFLLILIVNDKSPIFIGNFMRNNVYLKHFSLKYIETIYERKTENYDPLLPMNQISQVEGVRLIITKEHFVKKFFIKIISIFGPFKSHLSISLFPNPTSK